MRCFWEIKDGEVHVNYITHVLCTQCLRGPLARTLQLRATFFDAFTDIGSEHAKAFLVAKLQRAGADPAAATLRAGVDAPRRVAAGGGGAHQLAPEMVLQIESAMERVLDRRLASALPSALAAMQLAPEAVQVNINSSGRSNGDLRRINVPPPQSPHAEMMLMRDTLLVTDFLKEKAAELVSDNEEKMRLPQAMKSFFSNCVREKKRAAMEGGVPLPMVGQIGRAQVHYRQSDRPLMEQVWVELQHYRNELLQGIRHRIRASAAAGSSSGAAATEATEPRSRSRSTSRA